MSRKSLSNKTDRLPAPRVEPELRQALQELADIEDVKLTFYIYRILKNHVRRVALEVDDTAG